MARANLEAITWTILLVLAILAVALWLRRRLGRAPSLTPGPRPPETPF